MQCELCLHHSPMEFRPYGRTMQFDAPSPRARIRAVVRTPPSDEFRITEFAFLIGVFSDFAIIGT